MNSIDGIGLSKQASRSSRLFSQTMDITGAIAAGVSKTAPPERPTPDGFPDDAGAGHRSAEAPYPSNTIEPDGADRASARRSNVASSDKFA
jgi:hypothetical protein